MDSAVIADLLFLLVTAILIGFNALYVFHEFAFVMITPAQVRHLAAVPSRIARLVVKSARNLDHYIAVDQLGITVTSIAVGWIGQPVVADLLRGPVAFAAAPEGAVPLISGAIAFVLLTALQMIAGELIPKTVALRHPQRVAFAVATPVELSAKLLHPLVWALNGMGSWLVRLLGFNPHADGHQQSLPAEEIATMIEMSAKAGVLSADPATLRRALNFSDLHASDVLVPRRDVVALDMVWPLARVLEVARESPYTRFPVFEVGIDQVTGLLNLKDLVHRAPDGSIDIREDWQRAVRRIPTLPEAATIEQILVALRFERQPMALIVDEYGGTAGIVTITDITRRLIGDPSEVEQVSDGRYLVSGRTSIDLLESTLGISFGVDDHEQDSIGGLIMAELERIAVVGDRVTIGGHELEVTAIDGRRIAKVLFKVAPPEEPESDADAAE